MKGTKKKKKQPPFVFHDASVLHSVGGMMGGEGRERTVGRIKRWVELQLVLPSLHRYREVRICTDIRTN